MAEGIIKVDTVLPEHKDIDVLSILCRRGGPLLAVGAIDPVGGPQKVGQVLEAELPVRPLPDRGPDGKGFHDWEPALFIGLVQFDGLQSRCLGPAQDGKKEQDREQQFFHG